MEPGPLFSISTGCLSAQLSLDDPAGSQRVLASLAPPGLEVLLYRRWHARLDEAAALIREAGVPVRTVHGDKQIGGCFGHADAAERARGRRNFRAAVDFAAAVGAPYVNIHLWDLPDSDAHLDRNLATYRQVREYALERGVAVLFEVVPCRYHRPIENMEAAAAALGDEARFTLDLEFLAWHDAVEAQLPPMVERFGPQLVNLHARDYDGRPFREDRRRRYVRPGRGRIPFARVAELLAQAPAPRIITLEAAYRDEDWHAAIGADLDFLRRHFNATRPRQREEQPS